MADEFDPYKAWLNFENKTASTTYYALLGLQEFESDKDRITSAADKLVRQVRSHRPGAHVAEWSKLIDELQEVKACLLDDRKKAAYDEDLRFADEFVRELEGGIQRRPAKAAAAAPPKQTAPSPLPQDPRYPPGMGPPGSQPQARPKEPQEVELKVGPAPKPVDRKDSPLYPPSRSPSEPAKPDPPQESPAEAVGASPPQPYHGGTAPTAATRLESYLPLGAGSYSPPVAPSAGYFPAAGGMPPTPGPWQGQSPPTAYPLQQPGHTYGGPLAQPMGYGSANMPSHSGTPPMAIPMYAAPLAAGLPPQGYFPHLPPPGALDPMAPVAIPGTAMRSGAFDSATDAPPSATLAALPTGTAIAPSPHALAEEPQQHVRTNTAASVMLAAKKAKESQASLLILGVGGLLIVVVAGIVFFAATGGNFGGASVATSQPERSAVPGPSNVPLVPPTPNLQDNSKAPPHPAQPEIPAVPRTVAEKPIDSRPPDTKPAPEVKPESKPEPPKPEPSKPEPPSPEPPKPEPAKLEPKPTAQMPTREELVLLGNTLKNAKAAIGEFNFSQAQADLAKAEKFARLKEHQAKLARLKEVAGYVQQFQERLILAATGVDGGESFKVGTSTVVGMVEADQQQVVLRIAGQNRTYQYSELPPALAVALADMKLEGSDPVSRVLKGAYIACHKKANPDQLRQAKAWWDEATLGGADVTHLIPFLTDSYDLVKDLDKVPRKEEG